MDVVSPPNGGQMSIDSNSGSLRYVDSGRIVNGDTSNDTSNGFSNQPMAHLQDLHDEASRGLDKDHSITSMIDLANECLLRAQQLLGYRRPEQAYMYYIRCYQILVDTIYRNAAFPDLKSSKPERWAAYNKLVKQVSAAESQFTKVKEIIELDNKRNGTKPRLPSKSTSNRNSGIVSWQPQAPTSRYSLASTDSHLDNSASLNTVPNLTRASKELDNRVNSDQYNGSPTSSPIMSSNDSEALGDRFAKLRMPAKIDTAPTAIIYSPSIYSDASGQKSISSGFSTTSSEAQSPFGTKLNGPRPMNGTTRMAGVGLSLDAQVSAALPQLPSPAYSPARNMQITDDLYLPRSTARSMVGTGGRSNSAASSIASQRIISGASVLESPKTPFTDDSPPRPLTARRKSVHLPKETRVGAEKLYDYIKMHNVLIIDCRPRLDFDSGHIEANSVICIEPAALRKDMSATELQDSLILSPENEQDLYAHRDQFDLVVYYDTRTSSDQYLKNPRGPEDFTLRYLHDALLEFNHSSPLQRPPILLMGGIIAWKELVGSAALQITDTAANIKHVRPQRRVAVPGQRVHNGKRRLRDYNPLDANEERDWRERARKESVAIEPRSEKQQLELEEAESALDSIEEFNKRFPEAGSIGQTSPTQEYRDVPRPPRPPKVPDYPNTPLPSVKTSLTSSSSSSSIPAVPIRPAPSAPRMSYSGVNERSISQSMSKQYSSYLMPQMTYYLPRTGLVNFGVTCYMNATIQALSATIPLSHFFLTDRYQALVQRDNWKGSKGVLPDLFANLIRSIWKGDAKSIRPTTLRAFCARLNREWGMDRQQDAKEFLDFLVDCLHEDFNQNWSRSPLKALTEEQEANRERMPRLIVCKKEWDRYSHRESSYITSLFAGQHCSRLRCTTCNFTSTTYEAFYSISVEIPKSGRVATIEQCLESYCQEEVLSGDEEWKCPRCKVQREATKQIIITRAPQYLVIHFKRFSAGKNESAKKIRTPITFPLFNLDMAPYMLPDVSPAKRDQIAAQYNDPSIKTDATMMPPYRYDAYAVMRHLGTTLSSGHYTCLARDRALKRWRNFNDDSIQDFDPMQKMSEQQRLDNEMAYIVFYERSTSV